MLDMGAQGKFNHLDAVASLRPKPTKALPTLRSSHFFTDGWPEKRRVTLPAIHATKLFQSMLITTNTAPSVRKASALWSLPVVTNCGKNDTKNSTTLGFSTLVQKPCKKSCRNDLGAPAADVLPAASSGAGLANSRRAP